MAEAPGTAGAVEAKEENMRGKEDGLPRRCAPRNDRGKTCDGCRFLRIEAPVNRYDVWHACCTDPDKHMPGEQRTVDTAPAGSERGPVMIRRPRWCRRGKDPSTR